MLDVDSISNASLNGHFEVVRYLLDLGVVSNIESDIESDVSMYYESDYTTNKLIYIYILLILNL